MENDFKTWRKMKLFWTLSSRQSESDSGKEIYICKEIMNHQGNCKYDIRR